MELFKGFIDGRAPITTEELPKSRVKQAIIIISTAVIFHFLLLWIGIITQLSDSSAYLHVTHSAYDRLIQWDSQWYAAIGTYGYKIPLFAQRLFNITGNKVPFVPDLRTTVYFPLLPMLVHVFGIQGSVLITNALFVVTVAIMYTLFSQGTNKSRAVWGVLCYSVNPAFIYYSSLYSEVYLVLFSLIIVYGINKDSKGWTIVACLAGFLSALTHETGLFVGIFALRYLRTKKYSSAFAFIGSVTFGWIVYFGYLWVRYGQPTIPFKAEAIWGRTWAIPGVSIVHELFILRSNPTSILDLICVIMLSILAVSYIVRTIKQDHGLEPATKLGIHSLETSLWVLAQFLLCMSSYIPNNPLGSITRLLSIMWPVYSFVSFTGRKQGWQFTYVFVFGVFGYLGTVLYSHGYFFQ